VFVFSSVKSFGRIPSSFRRRNDVGNYRGVAILSCFAKLFKVKSSIISAKQGFFNGRSTVTNLIECISYVLNCMENRVQVNAIYADFSKAVYKVSHRLL
jgi:hypothetical protein